MFGHYRRATEREARGTKPEDGPANRHENAMFYKHSLNNAGRHPLLPHPYSLALSGLGRTSQRHGVDTSPVVLPGPSLAVPQPPLSAHRRVGHPPV